MLVKLSPRLREPPAVNAECVVVLPDQAHQPNTSIYRGNPLSVRVEAEGAEASLSFTLDEAAKLFALLRDSQHAASIRKAADWYSFPEEARRLTDCRPAAWVSVGRP